MQFIAFGDIHERPWHLESIREGISNASAVIITGDLTQFGSTPEARAVIEAIRSINSNIMAQAGNLDGPEVETWLADTGISLHGRGYTVGDIGIFGVGGSNPSPFGTPNELGEDDIAEILKKGYEEVKDAPFRIMVPHMPPHNTRVDIVHSGLHAGSKSVRNFIEKYQPDLCLTGHIHESAGEDRIGKTHILNPGPFYDGGFTVIEFDGKELKAELRFLA